jgi:hypothetical protein
MTKITGVLLLFALMTATKKEFVCNNQQCIFNECTLRIHGENLYLHFSMHESMSVYMGILPTTWLAEKDGSKWTLKRLTKHTSAGGTFTNYIRQSILGRVCLGFPWLSIEKSHPNETAWL